MKRNELHRNIAGTMSIVLVAGTIFSSGVFAAEKDPAAAIVSDIPEEELHAEAAGTANAGAAGTADKEVAGTANAGAAGAVAAATAADKGCGVTEGKSKLKAAAFEGSAAGFDEYDVLEELEFSQEDAASYFDMKLPVRGAENVEGNGYWHFSESDGILRYNSDKNNTIYDLPQGYESYYEFKEDNKEKIRKVIFESGPTRITDKSKEKEKEKCNYLPNLEEVVYEAPVTIGNMCFVLKGMFRDCPNLKKLTVGRMKSGNLQEMDRECFMNCPSLCEVSFGTGLWHIGRKSFAYCTGLTTFTFPDDIANVRGDSFPGCENLKEVKLSDSNQWMRSVENCIVEIKDPHKDERSKAFITPCLMMVPEGLVKENGGEYTVIKGIKDIQNGAFMLDLSLKKVTLASTVESIQQNAFNGCHNLETIYLPRSLKRVGDKAFSGYIDDSDESPVNSSLKDIYYEGSEDEWKKVNLAYYKIDPGYINKMSIGSTTTLWDHLEEAGIPAEVTVHFNTPIKDTASELKELIKGGTTDTTTDTGTGTVFPVETKTVSYNGPGADELRTLGMEMEMTYADTVSYCGRKHVLSTSKASSKNINDLVFDAGFKDVNTGLTSSAFKLSKVMLKNNKNAGDSHSAKPPYYIIQIKSASLGSLTPEDKAKIKAINKTLKTDPNARIHFTINPYDISGFTEKNYRGVTVNGEASKIKKIGFDYSYSSGGENFTGWILLKKCKNNDANSKGDYTIQVREDSLVVTGHGNYTGSIEVR